MIFNTFMIFLGTVKKGGLLVLRDNSGLNRPGYCLHPYFQRLIFSTEMELQSPIADGTPARA